MRAFSRDAKLRNTSPVHLQRGVNVWQPHRLLVDLAIPLLPMVTDWIDTVGRR
jgi:hypothetical protein